MSVCPSLNYGLRRGRKCALVSSKPAMGRADAIASSRTCSSSAANLELKSLFTSSVALRGCWMMAATTSSIVEELSGAKYHPMINH